MPKFGDDEEDYFYESLDRILSSFSSSSCSSSSAAEEEDNNCKGSNYASSIPRFPMSVSNYDIWISEPSSIQEHRKSLLRQMGLSSNASVCRLNSTISTTNYRRSVSCDFIHQPDITIVSDVNSDLTGVVQSKSDGVDICCSTSGYDHSSSSNFSPFINSISSVTETHLSDVNKPHSDQCDGSHKPPLGKPLHTVEESGIDSTNVEPNPNLNTSYSNPYCGNTDENIHCNEVVKDPDLVCTIKNLDNGNEFVVNEFREDGMWNKLREVGTDRQLTMEEFHLSVGHSPIVQALMRRKNVEELNGTGTIVAGEFIGARTATKKENQCVGRSCS